MGIYKRENAIWYLQVFYEGGNLRISLRYFWIIVSKENFSNATHTKRWPFRTRKSTSGKLLFRSGIMYCCCKMRKTKTFDYSCRLSTGTDFSRMRRNSKTSRENSGSRKNTASMRFGTALPRVWWIKRKTCT